MVIAFEFTTAPVSICSVLQLKTKDNFLDTRMSVMVKGNMLKHVMQA